MIRHSTFRYVLRVSALLVLSALPLAAQEPDQAFIRLDPKSRSAVDAMIDSAKYLGIPSSTLRSLVYEGVSKKADNGRIVNSVREQFGRLKISLTMLGSVGDEELAAAAAVLKAGAKPAQLQQFTTRQKGHTLLEAFTDWADLISRGVPSEEASNAIGKLWRDGADDATFHRLWNDVQADISQGLNPGAALQNRIREAPGRAPIKPTQPEGQKENQSSR